MRVAVDFRDERLDLDVSAERLVADWHGPAGVATAGVYSAVCAALEHPRQFPPLRQAVVPGDRVVIALDVEVPGVSAILEAVCDTLERAGVDAGSITVLVPPEAPAAAAVGLELDRVLPGGVNLAVHDRDDRTRLAYLATTAEGRRVYLDRLLSDADVVLPVGRLGYDAVLGYRGPWSLIFPGLSDTETARSFRSMTTAEWPDRDHPRRTLTESAEVTWLLGSQFHLGIVAGVTGPGELVVGLEAAVRSEGARAVDQAWTFEAEARAELVVAGIGRPGFPTRLDDLAAGLANAARLVRRGGKIVALSRAVGPIGPAFRRLLELDDPRLALAALRGLETAPDYTAAYQLAGALAWADLYLLSALEPNDLEDSLIIGLDRPKEARRLVAASHSCLFLSQAECVRARVAGE
jgi:hypothetical protein